MLETVLSWVSQYGYVAIFSAMMFGIVGLPIPDETILVMSGYLVYAGRLQLLPTVGSALLGSFCGITLSYTLGRTLGYRLIEKYGRIVHITPENLKRIHDWYARIGSWTLTFGYFIAGVRHFTAFVAGASKLEPSVFALFAYSGGVVWVLTFLSLGYFLGENWRQVWEIIHRNLLLVSALIVAAAVTYYVVRKRKQ